MKLVIDINRIIAALIKDGTTRDIIRKNEDRMCTVGHTLDRLEKHRQELCTRMSINEDAFERLLALIMETIDIIPIEKYAHFLPAAQDALGHIDEEDVPFLALALSKGIDIWSDDKHLKRQDLVKVWSTTELMSEPSKDTIAKIEAARARIKSGRFVTEQEARRRLGL